MMKLINLATGYLFMLQVTERLRTWKNTQVSSVSG